MLNAILHSVLDAAITIPVMALLGLVAFCMTFPILATMVAIGLAVGWSRKNKTLRRLQNWYVWFPSQRLFHSLYVPPRRRIARALMCKIKKSVLANKLDDFFDTLVNEGHITLHDKRELCVKIALALSNAELMPRGKRSRQLVRKLVEANCKEMRESLAKVGKTLPEPKPAPSVLTYLRARKTAA